MLTRLALVAVASCSVLNVSLLAETPPIEKIAPENTVLLIGSRNTGQTYENLKKGPLWAMWQSDKGKAMMAGALKEMEEGMQEMFKELGVDEDSLQPPVGAAGAAIFTVPDPDLGTPLAAVMAVGDWGERAEKMDTLVKAALERGKTEGQINFEERDVAGRNVFVIDLSKLQPEEEPEDEGMEFMPMPFPNPAEIFEGIKKLHYVCDGGTLLLCSDLTALTDALDVIDGRGDDAGTFTDREDFQSTISQVGTDNDAYFVLLTRDVMDLFAQQQGMGMMMMFRPMIRALVGEVGGYAVAAHLDVDGAATQQTVGVYMPTGKKGLTALLDRPAGRADVPGFVPAETVSYAAYNFEFAGMMDVIKSVIQSNPMLAMQAGDMMPEIEKNLAPIFNSLGGKMYSVAMSAGGQPMNVLAIECRDPQSFENALAQNAGPAGMEGRDFLGQRIYTIEEDMVSMMMPFPIAAGDVSIGIGGGHVYLGGTPGVEQALRATGQAGGGLAKDVAFERAVSLLGNDPVVAWGYVDTIARAEATMKQQQEQRKRMVEEMREWDPDMAAEMEKELAAGGGMMDDFDPAFFREYIGPSVWKVESNDKGFVLNVFTLPAK